jgi:hypothetical protein
MNVLRWAAAGAALSVGFTPVTRADAGSPQTLIAGLSRQQMENADGGSVDVDWVRPASTYVISGGLATVERGSSRWTVFKVAAAQSRAAGVALSGGLDVGPGTNNGDGFTFRKMTLGLSVPLTRRFRLSTQEMYVDVEPVSGYVVSVAGETTYDNGLSFRLQASRSVGGTLDERGRVARLDYRGKVPHFMAGAATSITNNASSLGALPTASVTTFRQAFVGMSFPVRRTELTIILEDGRAGTVRRSAVSFFVRAPIESPFASSE